MSEIVTMKRDEFLQVARILGYAFGEDGLDTADAETAIALLADALSVSPERLAELTGPWFMGDEKCPACEGAGAPGCCLGTGLETIGPDGPFRPAGMPMHYGNSLRESHR